MSVLSDMSSPLRRALNTDELNALGGQHLDRIDEPGCGVLESLVGDCDAVGVMLLLEVLIPVVRDLQERFVRSESRQTITGSLNRLP